MDFRVFETGESTFRVSTIDKGNSTMGERDGEGAVELIELFVCSVDPVIARRGKIM
jgi:hypothetical protein